MVLMPSFLEHLRGYAIDTVGLLQSSRGLGLLIALFVSGRITGMIDPRILIAVGLLCLSVSELGDVDLDRRRSGSGRSSGPASCRASAAGSCWCRSR